MINSRVGRYILLYTCFLLYSLVLVLARLAGRYPLLSWSAVLLYISCFAILGLYAILWQQVLKRMPLTIAYPNRAVIIPLGILWGILFFGEEITLNMAFGAAVIICGIVLMVKRDE